MNEKRDLAFKKEKNGILRSRSIYLEVSNIPVVAFTGIDVSSGRSVLSGSISTATDAGEVASDVGINASVQGNIDLVTIPVRVGTTSMTSL